MNKNQRKQAHNVLKMKRCRYCKATDNLTIDHKIPLSQGGKDELKNYQCLCEHCNKIKGGLSHKQVVRLFNWFLAVQDGRKQTGKKPYTLR